MNNKKEFIKKLLQNLLPYIILAIVALTLYMTVLLNKKIHSMEYSIDQIERDISYLQKSTEDNKKAVDELKDTTEDLKFDLKLWRLSR
ncbi:MAG: hypothetical protein EPN94_05050 [Nitrospirae bacterium]|nr:MAG: hypothetical protein EPN94_05050 [Nitrospirota bacterium]